MPAKPATPPAPSLSLSWLLPYLALCPQGSKGAAPAGHLGPALPLPRPLLGPAAGWAAANQAGSRRSAPKLPLGLARGAAARPLFPQRAGESPARLLPSPNLRSAWRPAGRDQHAGSRCDGSLTLAEPNGHRASRPSPNLHSRSRPRGSPRSPSPPGPVAGGGRQASVPLHGSHSTDSRRPRDTGPNAEGQGHGSPSPPPPLPSSRQLPRGHRPAPLGGRLRAPPPCLPLLQPMADGAIVGHRTQEPHREAPSTLPLPRARRQEGDLPAGNEQWPSGAEARRKGRRALKAGSPPLGPRCVWHRAGALCREPSAARMVFFFFLISGGFT